MRASVLPHPAQMDRVAGRPFSMVTASMSRELVMAMHLMQQISVPSEVVVIGRNSWNGVPEAIATRVAFFPCEAQVSHTGIDGTRALLAVRLRISDLVCYKWGWHGMVYARDGNGAP